MQLVHTAAVESGFRNSGLTLGRAGKFVAAVRSTHGLEVQWTEDIGQWTVDRGQGTGDRGRWTVDSGW